MNAVVATLAAESQCSPSAFLSEGVHIFEVSPERRVNPFARRFPLREHSLMITSIGMGVVVAASSEWMPWVSDIFGSINDPDQAFYLNTLGEASRRVAHYGYLLKGPHAYSITSDSNCRLLEAPNGYTLQTGGAELLEALNPSDWQNAISLSAAAQGRHNAVAVAALYDGEVVGVATASTDSDILWQLGIDVLAEHRGKGLGKALTSRTARAVLDRGKVPYYGSVINNIASRRTAQSAGFYPCWVSAYTTGRQV